MMYSLSDIAQIQTEVVGGLLKYQNWKGPTSNWSQTSNPAKFLPFHFVKDELTWNTFDRNFPRALAAEAGQAGVDFPDLSLLPLDQLLQDLLLLSHDRAELGVDDLRVELAAHQGRAVVVLDVAVVDGLGQLDVLAEALLLEVADGELISEGEEVENTVSNMIILKKESQKC